MEFLTEYKKLEEACRNINLDVKDLTDELNDADQNKLNISRQMRNFLVHNSEPGFLEFSQNQIKFIKGMTKMVSERDDLCSNHLIKKENMYSCLQFEKCSDVILRMSANKIENFVVFEKSNGNKIPNIIGVVNIFELSSKLTESKSVRVRDVLADQKQKNFKNLLMVIKGDEPYRNYINQNKEKMIILCTGNVKNKEKLIGRLK